MTLVRSVSVIVPVYNSAGLLPELVTRLTAVLEPLEYEIVLVNDGSSDASWTVIEELCAHNGRVGGLNLMRNSGQHNALLAGVRSARYDAVVTIDDDLQNPPEEIPSLLQELDKGYDVIYGTPAERHYGFWRKLATSLTRLALRGAIGSDIAGKASAYRAFRTYLRDAFSGFSGPYVSLDVLLSWGTTRFGYIELRHGPRAEGSSGYNFGRLATHAVNVLTGFSTRPLRFASLVGFASTAFGLAILVYVLTRYVTEGSTVAGFPFLASVIAIFSGAQLLTLGIIGEYLARMHGRILDRPTYAVRDEIIPDNQLPR